MGNDVIHGEDYFENGIVTNFRYGTYVSQAVKKQGQNFQYFSNFGTGWGMWDGAGAFNFIDDHDSQRSNGQVLNYKNGNQYVMGVSYMLAWNYGFPRVMSSYYFSNSDQHPPMSSTYPYAITSPSFNSDGTCTQDSGWVCEHRWPAIRNMATFRGVVAGTPNGNIVARADCIAFSRDGKGFFALNNGDGEWSSQ